MKSKLMRIVLTGAILIGGTTMALAGTVNNEIIPKEDIIPISAPINGDVSPISLGTTFTDIENHWAYNNIALMEAKGIWGDLTGEFEPNKAISSEEFLLYLDKIFDFEGNPDFGLEQEITRMEVAKTVMKSFEVKKLSVMTTLMFPIYDDTADLTPEESSALSFIFNTGIMKGRGNNNFFPNDVLTRAELATVLARTLDTLQYAEPIEEASQN